MCLRWVTWICIITVMQVYHLQNLYSPKFSKSKIIKCGQLRFSCHCLNHISNFKGKSLKCPWAKQAKVPAICNYSMTFDLTPSWSCIVFYGKCLWFVFRRNAVDLKGNMESSSVLKYKLPCWSIPPLSCIQLPCHYCHSLFLQESSMKWIHLSFHILVPQTECPIITPVLCHLPSPLMKKVLSTTCPPHCL